MIDFTDILRRMSKIELIEMKTTIDEVLSGEKIKLTDERKAIIIIKCVCLSRGIGINDLKRFTRKRHIVHSRQICFKLIRENTSLSLGRIGEILGNLNHATVLAGIKTINNLCDSHKEILSELKRINKYVKEEFSAIENWQ